MIEEYIYAFTAPNGVPSKCRIRTYLAQDRFHSGDLVIICSQLADDEAAGMSITNAAEHIATGVMDRHQVQPMRMVWIEHYPAHGTKRGDTYRFPETLDRVTFDVVTGANYLNENRRPIAVKIGLRRPTWTHLIERAFVETLIGESF
jgi:hypothetical protein